jgi:hypothetical protein
MVGMRIEMRKITFPLTVVLMMALIMVSHRSAIADVIQPMNPQMKQNLQDMSQLMSSLSTEMSGGI